MSIRYVGFDVHKRQITFCVVDPAGGVIKRGEFSLTRETLQQFIHDELEPTDQVALEVTTNAWAVADVLETHVAGVTVSNPLATKAIAQSKIKTDKVDAHVLAQLLRCDYLPSVWRPDADTRVLREITGRRSALVQQRTKLRNRIHSVLAGRLLLPPQTLFSNSGQVWLKQILPTLEDSARWMIESDQRQLESLQTEIDDLENKLAQHGYASDQVRLLMTLPGVSVNVAEALLAAMGDIKRFRSGHAAASYLGLTPSTRQSANKCYHGPITKRGNSQARWMLIQAAQHVARYPGPLGVFFRKLKKRKNHNVAVVAAARKLVVIAYQMLKENEPFRYAVPRSTEEKLRKLRIQATGERRRRGPAKGAAKQTAKQANPTGGKGTRKIKSIDQVYESEGLPPPKPLSPGEQKANAARGSEGFVEGIHQEQIVARNSKAASANESKTESTSKQEKQASAAGGKSNKAS